ncbi:unnamed protein product [Rotaria magnacalcarata]
MGWARDLKKTIPWYGTVFVTVPSHASISAIRTKKKHEFVDNDCCSVEDLLKANIGQDIQLLVINNTFKSTEWISGKIKSVKQNQLTSDVEDNDTVVAQGNGIAGIQNFSPVISIRKVISEKITFLPFKHLMIHLMMTS